MRKMLALCAAATAIACAGTTPPASPTPIAARGPGAVLRGTRIIPPTWTLRARAVTAPHAMVVSAHPLASQAGLDILQQGGNAMDAAVAVGFALEVVLPDAGNIGGGGFIVQRTATGDVSALDYREAAPSGASHDMYVDSAGNVTNKSEVGHLASGVPGSVAGLYAEWQRHGSLPWAAVIAPAIRLAQGHVIDTARSRDIASDRELLAQFPASRAQFLVHDSAPPPGTTWRQPDLARTLQLISDSGPDVFYRGQIADLIGAEMQPGGVCPPAHGSNAARLHRPQPLARRSRFCRHAARAAALEVVRRDAARPDRSAARHAHATPGDERRGDAHNALLRRRREGERRFRHHDLEWWLRQRRHRDRRGLLVEQRDGRFHVGPRQAEYVRAHPGRGKRDPAPQTDALGDDAVDRDGLRRPGPAHRRLAWRPDYHHDRHGGDSERGGPAHESRRCDCGSPHSPPGAPRSDVLRARRLERRDGAGGTSDGT